ncbi:hypothetical protein ACEPAH_1412 [Sanghuangporus vaninii]
MMMKLLAMILSFSKRSRSRKVAPLGQKLTIWYQLPIELWLRIFTFLDKVDLMSFTRTSHSMRSISIASLFSSIRLRAGYYILDQITETNEKKHLALAKKSISTLQRFTDPKPLLGVSYPPNELVRNLRIVSGFNIKDKHKRILLLAMERLKNLRNLTWTDGVFPGDVADAVAASCKSLDALRISCFVDHPLLQLSALEARLRNVEVMDNCTTPCVKNRSLRIPFHKSNGLHHAKLLTQRNQKSIETLAIYGPDPSPGNQQLHGLFNGPNHLVNLIITGPGNLSGLYEFLRESPAVESLALLDIDSLSSLPLDVDVLLNLMDFKIYLDIAAQRHPTSTMSEPLISFIRIHERLRRFDMSFCGALQFVSTAAEEDSSWFMELLKVICTLEHLQVLGITFPELQASEVSQALNMLSEHARSLETCTAVRIEGMQNSPIEVVTAKLRSCKFLVLSDIIHCSCLCINAWPPLLTVEDLVYRHGLTKLEQTILFGVVYDIRPVEISVEEKFIGQPWDSDRVRWRTETDFCNPDAHWLMSYRTIRQFNFAPPELVPLDVGPQ